MIYIFTSILLVIVSFIVAFTIFVIFEDYEKRQQEKRDKKRRDILSEIMKKQHNDKTLHKHDPSDL